MHNQVMQVLRMSDSENNIVTYRYGEEYFLNAEQYASNTGRLYVMFNAETGWDDFEDFVREARRDGHKLHIYGRGKRDGRVGGPSTDGGKDLKPTDKGTEYIVVTLRG